MHEISLSIAIAVFVIAIAYALCFSVAVRSFHSSNSIDDFFIYNRRLPYLGVFVTLYSTEMSLATVFIAFMQLAPSLGFSLIWSIATFVTGQLVVFLMIPVIKKYVSNGETLQSFLRERYNSRLLQIVSSSASILGFIGLFATELIIGAEVFRDIFGTDQAYWAALVFTTFLVIFYTSLGGFRSVVITDKFQTLGIVFVIAVLITAALTEDMPSELQLDAFESWRMPGSMMLNFMLINIVFPLVDMSTWQRIAAAKSSETARAGFGTGIFMFILSWSAILFVALSFAEYTARAEDAARGGELVPILKEFGRIDFVKSVFGGLGIGALATILLSTGDTFLIAAVQSFCMDIAKVSFFSERRRVGHYNHIPVYNGNHLHEIDDDQQRHLKFTDWETTTFARRSVFIMALLGMMICLPLQIIGFRAFDFVFVIYGSTVAMAPCVMYALVYGSQEQCTKLLPVAVISVVVGIAAGWVYGIVSVLGFLGGESSVSNAPSVALVSSFLIFSCGVLWYRRR